MSEIENICEKCKWEDETPPSPEEWERLKADSKRLDKFLFLSACISDEGYHPLSREEFDECLERFKAEGWREEQP